MLLKIINGGHTWPGSVGVTGIGNTNRDISASMEIWKFVSRFSLNTTTNLQQIRTDKLILYPNPVSGGTLITESTKYIPGSVFSIITSDGRTIISHPITENSTRNVTDVSRLTPGIYLVKISNSETQAISKLIIR
jgi:polyhydroxybutyrate depolymerase